jgi:hypothetical protein
MDREQALQRLAHAGVVERDGADWRTTAKWQRAFMRAEERVLEFNESVDDARVPVTYALVEVLGTKVPDEDLGPMVEAILPLELAEEEDLELEAEIEE